MIMQLDARIAGFSTASSMRVWSGQEVSASLLIQFSSQVLIYDEAVRKLSKFVSLPTLLDKIDDVICLTVFVIIFVLDDRLGLISFNDNCLFLMNW